MRSVTLSPTGQLAISSTNTSDEKPSVTANVLKPNHVLVRVRAFAINRADLLVGPSSSDASTERVPGVECVGTVEDAGSNPTVKGLRVGATVACFSLSENAAGAGGGLWKDYVMVPTKNVFPLRVAPAAPGMPLDAGIWSKLAAVPLTFITAFGIVDALDLRSGDRLLIRGATSSIGMAVATIAKSIGAIIASTTRDPTKAPSLSNNGADFVILDREGGISNDVRMMFPSRRLAASRDNLNTMLNDTATSIDTAGADKAVDLVGITTLKDTISALRAPGGICCLAGTLGQPSGADQSPATLDPTRLLPSGVYLTTFDVNQLDLSRVPLQDIVDRALQKEEFRLNLDRTFLMDQVGKAGEYIASGKASGKVVVVVNDEIQ
ncbi:uncharacterized protein EV422DRAFT_516839 [Fimicolochytrium jonesii]|uniref:uncharacterized protein n=1 Tax=Fimicolochytrium jonesii TaxID=1396493 RepID=UPI0022FE395C|nr:uncharacterized protein EV422DRAFT_516839 [Fimicolochytrium jonesii]KAI8824946.1 hypothetical protein EV422DRAFT_516839 [Fimicolochytrium jonesii]